VYGEYVLACKGLSFHARRPNGTTASDQDMVQISEHDERTLVATMVAASKTYYGDINVTFSCVKTLEPLSLYAKNNNKLI
jgi:hypothetical protein